MAFHRMLVKRQIRPAQTDAVNFSIKPALQRFADLIERELDARRAAIDGQDFLPASPAPARCGGQARATSGRRK
jgi:hypothetical protein